MYYVYMNLESSPLHSPAQETERAQEITESSYVNICRKYEKKHSLSSEEVEELVSGTIEFLKNSGGIYCEDVSTIYRAINHEIVVRRENPIALIESVSYHEPLELKFEGDIPYSNSALWQIKQGSEGLKNTFEEGFSSVAGIAYVAGYEKTHLSIQKPTSSDVGTTKYSSSGQVLSREHVVASHGSVDPDDIDFIVVRIPISYMKEDELRDEEIDGGDNNRDGKLKYVFRGVLYPRGVIH